MRTLIIAEIGVNHDGDGARAREMIALAARSGADVVKFQTFKAQSLSTRSAPKAAYQHAGTRLDESQMEMLKRLELSAADHRQLVETCQRLNVEFLSTAFDLESAEFLDSLGMQRSKVPSGEITNLPLLRHLARSGRPVLLSTGMATLAEIESAIEVLTVGGIPRSDITLLQCNTQYPTPMADVNLLAMQSMGRAFSVAVGYSDHTVGIEIPVAAVALGATVIEKHFTVDKTLPGPDHASSLEPAEFESMVKAIRNVERALGDGIKRPSPSEMLNRTVVRKSLVASRPIAAGEKFTLDNLAAKRPGTGLSPMCLDEVIGKAARRAYDTDEQIEP